MRTKETTVAAGLLAFAAGLAACSDGGAARVCEPGETQHCACLGGDGVQTCADDGTRWTSCECGAADADADDADVPDEAGADDETSPEASDVDADAPDAEDSLGDDTPDSPDLDSDGDTFPDRVEGTTDRDGDGTPNYLDLDSDGDGFSDAQEAGDADLATPPRDTDGGGIPDFLDTDSDDDGLPDIQERTEGTDPTVADTDDDGFSDLLEVACGGDPEDPLIGLAPESWCIVLPPDGSLEERELRFDTSISPTDVFFLVDTTASMYGEIDSLVATMGSVVIPGIRARVYDAAIGVGYHADFASGAYGSGTDAAFRLLQTMTLDTPSALAAVAALPRNTGGDNPDSQVEALYQVATGEGLSSWVPVYSSADCRGAPCFRAGALPIIVHLTDAPFHNGPPGTVGETYAGISPAPHAWADAIGELNSLHAKYLGMSSEGGTGRAGWHDMEATAIATGAIDVDGRPLVFDVGTDGALLSTSIVDAIEMIATRVPFDVDTYAEDDPTDPLGIDETCFVRRVIPLEWYGPTGTPHDPFAASGMDESTFYEVMPGTRVEFVVQLQNVGCYAGGDLMRAFQATIVVQGDHVTRLDERIMTFVVPALEIPAG